MKLFFMKRRKNNFDYSAETILLNKLDKKLALDFFCVYT